VPVVSTTAARRKKAQAHLREHAHDAVAVQQQVVDRLLEQRQVRLVLDRLADRGAVQRAVGLAARRAHRRALAGVQRAPLDAGAVGRPRHDAAQRIDLAHQVALADAADRRVAAHLPHGLDLVRQQQRARAHARSRQRGLGAGMAAADDDHVEIASRFARRWLCEHLSHSSRTSLQKVAAT
jgi:hypothetical protein